MSNKIHAKYNNLPASIEKSEVLASDFASEAMKMNTEDDVEEIVSIMDDWDKHLRTEGITISNRAIEVFSEITKLCVDAGKQELSGRFAITIVDVLQGITKQYMASSLIIDKLDAVAGTLFTEVDELKKANLVLANLLPKHKVTPRKKNQSTTVVKTGVPPPSGNTPVIPAVATGNPEEKMKDKMKPDETDMEAEMTPEEIDPNSAIAKQMRDSYRAHYSCPEFTALPVDRQLAALEYYISHILGVAATAWEKQPPIYHMLSDLIDKERIMKMMTEMKNGTVTEDDIADSVDEIADAINVCHAAYGNFMSIATITNGRTKLHIS